MKLKRTQGVLLKLDFEKAFDTVNWNFLVDVLEHVNFGAKWILWIKSIFQSIHISVLVNGSPTSEFSPSRGLRQGDPLFPLLFNLVGQILHHMIRTAKEIGKFQGISVGHDNITFTHLQFADDTLLFVNGDDDSINNIKSILLAFQLLSGLKINFQKSELLAMNYPTHKQMQWETTLGCKLGNWPLTYLGVPLGMPSNNIAIWDKVIQKFHNNLNNWAASHLKMAGKLVLMKATLDSLSAYWFNFLVMLKGVKDKIDSIRGKFLSGNHKLCLTNWSTLLLNKQSGGLGITNFNS